MSFCTTNPATSEKIKDYQYLPSGEVDRRLQEGFRAWQIWRHAEIHERQDFLKRLAVGLREFSLRLARQMTLEMGKPLTEARAEVEKSAATCEFIADQLPGWLGPESVQAQYAQNYICKESKGPIFTVMPWNFPLWQVIRFAAPALAAGNTVCLKHSDIVAGTAELIEEVFQRACHGHHLLLNFCIDHEQAGFVIADHRIRGVTFTGSARGGREVARAAGANLKKVVLELGGNDAYIVLADADVALAAKICAAARLLNSGQSCIAAKRFFVEKQISEEFKKYFIEALAAAVVGPPEQEKTQVGPLAHARFKDNLETQVDQYKKRGAKTLWRQSSVPLVGSYYAPEILLCDPRIQAFHQEELFGPVAVLFEVDSPDSAILYANQSPYGLGGAIFSRDLERAKDLASELECGMVAINDSIRSDPRLPFGGVKDSGFGRELAYPGFAEFLNLKTVGVQP